MIDWVHIAGKDWGRYIRRPVNGWPSMSVSGRIATEGSVGAAIKQHFQKIPVDSMPSGVLPFHRAYLRLPEKLRRVVFVVYAVNADRDAKAETLGLSRSQMYRLLDQAHNRIYGAMAVSDNYEPHPYG